VKAVSYTPHALRGFAAQSWGVRMMHNWREQFLAACSHAHFAFTQKKTTELLCSLINIIYRAKIIHDIKIKLLMQLIF